VSARPLGDYAVNRDELISLVAAGYFGGATTVVHFADVPPSLHQHFVEIERLFRQILETSGPPTPPPIQQPASALTSAEHLAHENEAVDRYDSAREAQRVALSSVLEDDQAYRVFPKVAYPHINRLRELLLTWPEVAELA